MRQGKTLQDLAVELERQSKAKRDFVADSRALSMRYGTEVGLNVDIDGHGTFAPTDESEEP